MTVTAPDDNLTRAEARDRAIKISGVSYQVTLDLTGDGDTFSSETVLRFTAPLVGLATFVDLDAAGVREISFNGKSFDPSVFDPGRSRIPLRTLLANNELRVVADCRYQHTGVGLHRFVDPIDEKTYLHTQCEPYDAHRVFACFDQPDLKGPVTMSVVAPADWTVVANSPVTAQEEPSGGNTLWRFSATPEIPTYLVAVVAGPYHVVRSRHQPTAVRDGEVSDGPIHLAVYCRQSLAKFLDADELFELTRQGIDFFEAEFSAPYPFDKYDQVFVPEFNFGAMENPGCITFNEAMIFRSRQTDSAHANRANTLLHEMAHMWFGDLVTMRWWDDLWLNESFATYMATDALRRATRFDDAWVRFAAETKSAAVVADQLPSTHPISADIVDTDAIRLHFDRITYDKGASVLKQLVAWVGPDAFTAGVRHYFGHHQWANAELADFLSALEQTSGRKLSGWAEQWLQTAGVNTLRADFDVVDGVYSSFALTQTGQVGHDTLRSHRVAAGLYRVEPGGVVVRRRRVELDVEGARTDVSDLVGERAADLVLVNDDDLTYAKIRLDPLSLATVVDHLSGIADPLARNLCWAAAWHMTRDGELAARRWISLVNDHAPGETDDTTLARLLGQAVAAADAYGQPSNRSAARGAMAAAGRAGLDAAEGGSDRQLVWVRHLLAVADSASDLTWVRGLLDASVEVAGLAVDTDLRWSAVATLVVAGVADTNALVAAELDRDPTDMGRRRAAAARASAPDADAKAEAWKALMNTGVHLAELRSLAGSFWQFGQDELLGSYAASYFDSVEALWSQRTREEALSLLGGLYPRTLIGPGVVQATSAALGRPGIAPPVRRILAEGRDGVERALRARSADLEG